MKLLEARKLCLGCYFSPEHSLDGKFWCSCSRFLSVCTYSIIVRYNENGIQNYKVRTPEMESL
jgi:hypothetical protein